MNTTTRLDPTLTDDSHRSNLIFTAIITLSLTPLAQAENPLEEIVVTSSRIEMPLREVGTSISVLNADDISQRGFLSLPDLLRTQPSVAASNNGGAGKATTLRIRGEEGYRTLVLLDGIDVSDTSGPQVSPRLEQLLTQGIERIEILRGPQGLMYGADAGGVISMRSASPDAGLGGAVSAEGGRYGTQQFSGRIGGDFDRVDVLASVTHFETDGFNSRSLDTVGQDADGYQNDTLHARVGWDASENLRLEAVLHSIDAQNEYDSCFSASFMPTNNCNDDYRQDAWRASADLQRGAFHHQVAYSDNRTERDFFSDGSLSFFAQGGLESIGYSGSFSPSETLTLVYGMDHETESIDDGSTDRDRDQTGIYGEYQGRFSDKLTLTAGVRSDDNDDFGSYASYRVSGAWVTPLAGGQMKLKAAYGTGFRAPSLFEISYNRGPFASPPASDAILDAEESRGYDIGVVVARDDGAFVELNWFDQQVDDLIVFDIVGFSGYVQDAGESFSQGVELAGELPIAEYFMLRGNYTWNETETPSGEQRPFRPETLANLGMDYRSGNERLRIGLNVRASRDAVGTAGEALDDYYLVDLNASFEALEGLTIYTRLENALDERYQEIPTYFTARRAAYAGVRYAF
jgi:vitamin B12 transporter